MPAQSSPPLIQLRAILDSDLAVFFEQQREPEACRMASFPSRNREAFFSHWQNKILGDDSVPVFAIDIDGKTAGYVLSWKDQDRRWVGFWLGQTFWNRGIATSAVSDYLRIMTERPLYAHVALENIASMRVLEKCGFVVEPSVAFQHSQPADGVAELVFCLMTPDSPKRDVVREKMS